MKVSADPAKSKLDRLDQRARKVKWWLSLVEDKCHIEAKKCVKLSPPPHCPDPLTKPAMDLLESVFFNMHAFCHPEQANMTAEFREEMETMKKTFAIFQICGCIVGVIGNCLNLRALQSPSLQSVPFMYIRALAIFDLISLSLILLHFYISHNVNNHIIMGYVAHAEAALINTFLIAGLYCAFMLTVERYTLISRPHFKPSVNPHALAKRKIIYVLLLSAFIHTPMMLQNKLKVTYNAQTNETTYSVSNNVELLCEEPRWTIFNYYKMIRECLRFLCVIVMTVLNTIIARELQLNKIRRRRLVRRTSPSDPSSSRSNDRSSSSPDTSTYASIRQYTGVAKSFAEKKLTALMVSICFIFNLGNLPQILVMMLQNESMENVYWFQLFRNIANFLEVMNHCLNFYVFCFASTEYMKAFIANCPCLASCHERLGISDFIAGRRPSRYDSAMISVNVSGMMIGNRNFGSTDTINYKNVELVQTSSNGIRDSSSNSEQSDTRLRSILLPADRDRSEKTRKSLTIVNHLVVPSDNEFEETIQL